jgi:hypothetical protein
MLMSIPSRDARPGPGPGTEPSVGWPVLGALALSAVAGLGIAWLIDEHRSARARPAGGELRLRLDLNRASARELELLPGVGSSRALRLVRERERRGGFHSLRELDERDLLGPGASQRLGPYLLPIAGPDAAPGEVSSPAGGGETGKS